MAISRHLRIPFLLILASFGLRGEDKPKPQPIPAAQDPWCTLENATDKEMLIEYVEGQYAHGTLTLVQQIGVLDEAEFHGGRIEPNDYDRKVKAAFILNSGPANKSGDLGSIKILKPTP